MNLIERLFPATKPANPGAKVSSLPSSATPSAAHGTPPPPVDPKLRELQLRRTHLAEQLAERQWDLGGVAYEMAIRDHFRMDVLVKLAAELQGVDAELAEVERLLRLEHGGAAGECPVCRAPHSRGAVYCWSCGGQLMATETKRVPAT